MDFLPSVSDMIDTVVVVVVAAAAVIIAVSR
jgi:hypothetical protein